MASFVVTDILQKLTWLWKLVGDKLKNLDDVEEVCYNSTCGFK